METKEKANFGIIDYTVFTSSLILSVAVGVYFRFFGNKKQSEEEYLYGSRKMGAIPVGLSLYSSAASAVSIIGVPIEIYYFGTGYLCAMFGIIIGMLIIWTVFLPIFCGNLSIKTPYEYFERRFGNNVKLMSSFIYVFNSFLVMPVVLYAPSLALSQATNIHVLICTTIIGLVCIYTTFGGFRTVVWTDTLQATLMIVSYLFIALAGVNKAGGISEVWRIAQEGNRINWFNMNPNPFIRTTFWTTIIGIAFFYSSHSGCSASALQRYMSVQNQNQGRISTFIGTIGSCLITIIGGLTGLAMYAIYSGCDPVKNKTVTNSNQLVPYMVMQTFDYIPGFPGFFIAGLLSAALSTLTSELNVVAGIIYYDFLSRFCNNNFVKKRGTLIMKIIVLIIGLIYLLLAPLLQKTKHIFELMISIAALTFGAKLGVLFLGILFPRTNSKGAITGVLVSMLIIGWIDFGAHYHGISSYYILPTSTKECIKTNSTVLSTTTQKSTIKQPNFEDIFILYRLSYLYYCFLGTVVTIVVGNIVSYVTGPNNIFDVDPLLIAPFLRPYIRKQKQKVEMYMQEQ